MKPLLSVRRLSQALLLSLPFWVGACRRSADPVLPLSEAIKGTWRYVSYTIDPSFDLLGNGTKTNDLMLYYEDIMGPQTNACFIKTTLTFGADGNLTGAQPSPCTASTNPVASKATWAVADSKLTVKTTFAQKEYDVAMSGNTLRMSYSLVRDFDNNGKSEPATLSLNLTKQ